VLNSLKKIAIPLICLALVAVGATVAFASKGGHTGGVTAATTQYNTGGQGCTPGYWKNNHAGWVTYSPTDSFDKIFGITKYPATLTLQGALELGGGGFNALARHAAAALLNTANSNVNYLYSTAEVIKIVQEAVAHNEAEAAKDLLAGQNETACSIDAHGNPT
jgi:hypothetical protein